MNLNVEYLINFLSFKIIINTSNTFHKPFLVIGSKSGGFSGLLMTFVKYSIPIRALFDSETLLYISMTIYN